MASSPMKTTANATEDDPPPSSLEHGNDDDNNDIQNNTGDEGFDNNTNADIDKNAGDAVLGSGLAAFFGDFIPHRTDIEDRPIGFSTLLSQLPAKTDPIDDADLIEANIGVKYVDGGLPYTQWQTVEKEYLADYLMLRLHPNASHEGEAPIQSVSSDFSPSEYSEIDCVDTQAEPESHLAMETQEPIVTEIQSREEEKSSGKRKRSRGRRDGIPCIGSFLHHVTKLEYLDLYARTLTLNLSRIDKVWRLRDTKRSGIFDKRSIAKPVYEKCPSKPRSLQLRRIPQRLVFEEKEEDGPVASAYKSVAHLELEQLHVVPQGGIGSVLGGLNNLFPPPNADLRTGRANQRRRIKVFFYNAYATAVSKWIKQQQQKTSANEQRRDNSSIATSAASVSTIITIDIVMSLSKVPALCVFPYAVDPRNWREKENLVEYCICIGDESTATNKKRQQEEDSDSEHCLRFDSKELEIRLMAVVRKTTTSSKATASGDIVTTDVIDYVDDSSELIISRRALEKKYLLTSSGEENGTEGCEGEAENGGQDGFDSAISPLKESWNAYQNNRDHEPNKNEKSNNSSKAQPAASAPPNPGHVAIRGQSAAILNEAAALCQANQQPRPQSSPPMNQRQSEAPRNDAEEQIVVEPMMFHETAQRKYSKPINYVRLSDIATMVHKSTDAGKGCNFKVNFYASVVAVSGPPRITRRGDWAITATLMDESCLTPMTMNMFCRNKDDLPQLVWMGDVIRIHRAAPEKWYGKIQINGLKATQYVVIRRSGPNWHVLPTARNFFSFNRSDEQRSQALWRWANRYGKESPTMKAERSFTLHEMQHLKNNDDKRAFEDRDITAMVVQKMQFQPSGVLPHGLLRVWDGTGNPPSDPLFMQAKILNPPPEERREAVYSKAIEQVASASRQLQALIDTMEIPLSLCGRVSNVVVWEKSHWDLINKNIPIGAFLRLRNVHIPPRWEDNNFRCIFVHDKSWMTALPTNNFEVRSLLCRHNERVRKGGPNNEYNREFGGEPAALPRLLHHRFVGNGLSRFRGQEKANVFTGAVHLMPSRQAKDGGNETIATVKVVTAADRSGSIQALATESARHELEKLLLLEDATDGESSLRPAAGRPCFSKILNSNRRYLVAIRVFGLGSGDERKRFVLTNLAPIV